MNPVTQEHNAVRMQRTISAPPERVYRAWLDPELIARWLAPGTMEVTRVEVDERVGGHYRVWQSQDGRPMGGFESRIEELEENRRLVFSWGLTGPDREAGPVYDSQLTIELEPEPGGGTRLILHHERLEELWAAMPELAGQFAAGWADVLEKLAAL